MEYAQLNPAETNVYRAPEEVKNEARQLARYAEQNPWTAAAVGFGLGVLFGTLVTLLALKN
ncbi:MAG TPA: DUF883 C-terminal domain-containing protein [Burkholderiales bacterium]|nr:DUF883 C-terminal domain-containing protein [Burkholderiales bacterium]